MAFNIFSCVFLPSVSALEKCPSISLAQVVWCFAVRIWGFLVILQSVLHPLCCSLLCRSLFICCVQSVYFCFHFLCCLRSYPKKKKVYCSMSVSTSHMFSSSSVKVWGLKILSPFVVIFFYGSQERSSLGAFIVDIGYKI